MYACVRGYMYANMCVCVCVCVFVHVCMRVWMHVCMLMTSPCVLQVCVCMRVCMYVDIQAHHGPEHPDSPADVMHGRVCACAHVHEPLGEACMDVCMDAWMHVCMWAG
jgi:hypothetical protein